MEKSIPFLLTRPRARTKLNFVYMAFYNGYDQKLDSAEVMAEFENYYSFVDAARMIDRGWTTNYLHKHKVSGRLDKAKILYIIDEGMRLRYPSTGGKKMFLHISEIERFKKEVYPTIRKQKRGNWETFCTWCRASISDCFYKPCYDRMQTLLMQKARNIGNKQELIELSKKTELSIKIKESKRGRFKKR